LIDRQALAAAVASLDAGAAGPLRLVRHRPWDLHSSYPLEELWAVDRRDREQRLLLKDLAGSQAADAPWRVKPSFLHDPLREIVVYRDLVAPQGIPAPGYRGASVDPAAGRHWLFLDLVDGIPLWQTAAPAPWRLAAQTLAWLHGRFLGRSSALPERLLTHDRSSFERWLERARRFVRWPEVAPGAFAILARRVESALEWLDEQPVTLLHGEPYPSNLLVARDGGEHPLVLVDWEMAGLGAGLLDLAALLGGHWQAAERNDLAEAYRRALPPGSRPTRDELAVGLDHSRLLRAVQWLGWSAQWTPPAEHRHPWLAEAMTLAAERHSERELHR
jgi:aminoglycoside phosphotransferase (APT) family kinase protein